tara:strand:- start:753 stop:887 length:135 start_codon:yes stop_codon:yes gene_type:complete
MCFWLGLLTGKISLTSIGEHNDDLIVYLKKIKEGNGAAFVFIVF